MLQNFFINEGTQFSQCSLPTNSLISSGDMEKFRRVIVYHSMPSVLSGAFPCDPTSRFCPFMYALLMVPILHKAIAKGMMLQQESTIT